MNSATTSKASRSPRKASACESEVDAPLRILNVLNYYAPYTSGLSNFAREIGEQYARSGHAVTVLTGRHLPDLPEQEVLGGVQVVRANPLAFLHKGYLSADFFRRYRQLIRHADMTILHAPMLEAGPLTAITPGHVPIALLYHCEVVPSRDFHPIDWTAIQAVRLSSRAAARRARAILVTSLDFARHSQVLRGFSDRFFELHPLDSVGHIQPRSPRQAGDVLRIGFLGRFVEEKGIDVLLRAVPLVVARLPGARFTLGGDFESVMGGSAIERLRPLLDAARASVDLPGRIPDAELSDFYWSLDAFVLPSINSYESFGLVQVEAMKHGVPVVASDLPGVRVPIQLTGNGRLAPPGDPEALAAAIIDTLTTPPDPVLVAVRAWSVFSPQQRRERLAALLEKMRL